MSEWLAEELARNHRQPVLVAGSVMANEEIHVLRAFAEVEREFPLRAVDSRAAQAGPLRRSGQDYRGIAARTGAPKQPHSSTGRGARSCPRPVACCCSIAWANLRASIDLADAVFVGGSLVPSGGHNILEPAAFSKVPVYGPSMDNFREMAAKFLDAGAAVQVNTPEALGAAWVSLLKDDIRAMRMGAAARELVEQNRGATARVLARIEQIVDPSRSPA